jgi:hypothetical protein
LDLGLIIEEQFTAAQQEVIRQMSTGTKPPVKRNPSNVLDPSLEKTVIETNSRNNLCVRTKMLVGR